MQNVELQKDKKRKIGENENKLRNILHNSGKKNTISDNSEKKIELYRTHI